MKRAAVLVGFSFSCSPAPAPVARASHAALHEVSADGGARIEGEGVTQHPGPDAIGKCVDTPRPPRACTSDEFACPRGCVSRAILDQPVTGRRVHQMVEACKAAKEGRLYRQYDGECQSSVECGGGRTCCAAPTRRDMVESGSIPYTLNVCTDNPPRDCVTLLEEETPHPEANFICGRRRCREPRPVCFVSHLAEGKRTNDAQCIASDENAAGAIYRCGSKRDCPAGQKCFITGNGLGGSFCAFMPTSGLHSQVCANNTDCEADFVQPRCLPPTWDATPVPGTRVCRRKDSQ